MGCLSSFNLQPFSPFFFLLLLFFFFFGFELHIFSMLHLKSVSLQKLSNIFNIFTFDNLIIFLNLFQPFQSLCTGCHTLTKYLNTLLTNTNNPKSHKPQMIVQNLWRTYGSMNRWNLLLPWLFSEQ